MADPGNDAGTAGRTSPDRLRAALIERLRAKGALPSPAVAEAFGAVPRHLFVPEVSIEEAYRDRFIATKRMPDGEVVSSSSQPEIMAIMLEQLDVRPGQRVLEVGAGTGYNAALLAHLVASGGSVTTVDIDDDLVAGARAHLTSAGVTGVRVLCGDGWAGVADGAPYDRIVLTVGAHDLSPAWWAQLAPGGRLLLPLSLPAVQASVAFDERDGILESVSVRGCMFMRLRGSAAVPMRRVAVGPEPAAGVWPRGDHTIDGAAVHALLQTAPSVIGTGLVVRRHALYDGLVLWLALHDLASAWFVAQGAAVAAGLVPPVVGDGDDVASTFGVFESGGVALLARDGVIPDDGDRRVHLAVRGHGDPTIAARLRDGVLAWDRAERPELSRLRVRAIPIERPYQPRAGEIVVTRPCTRLILDWPRHDHERNGGDRLAARNATVQKDGGRVEA